MLTLPGVTRVGEMLQFDVGREYWGTDYAMFRTVDMKERIQTGAKTVFVDANVLVDGRMVTGDVTRVEARKLFERFREEYGIVRIDD